MAAPEFRPQCFFHDCTRPSTTLIVNTELDSFPAKNGAATACHIHSLELLRDAKWPCARVEGWPA